VQINAVFGRWRFARCNEEKPSDETLAELWNLHGASIVQPRSSVMSSKITTLKDDKTNGLFLLARKS
jgi:hypothetical protein